MGLLALIFGPRSLPESVDVAIKRLDRAKDEWSGFKDDATTTHKTMILAAELPPARASAKRKISLSRHNT